MDLGLDYSDGDWDHLRKLLVEESINKNNVNNVNMVQVINNNMDNIVLNNMEDIEDNTDSQTVKCGDFLAALSSLGHAKERVNHSTDSLKVTYSCCCCCSYSLLVSEYFTRN